MMIRLTEKERRVFSLLMRVVETRAPGTVLRAAGGWVRDKLLGRESSDIDVSPDNMSGEAFALLVKGYMDGEGIRSGEIAVVKANPAQSKHLETAMLSVLGQPIDFVQLRSEGYSEASRIPSDIRPGTPEEDASRRDLTINALFYNINENRVEDHVGGLRDLESLVARTPIEPFRTFMDDPLRVLRAVRFAAELGLTLDGALIAAARREEVREALFQKVSKERVWNELAWKAEPRGLKAGALSGRDPVRAARLLGELNLLDCLLTPDKSALMDMGLQDELAPLDMDQRTPYHALSLLDHTLLALEYRVEQLGPAAMRDVRETTVAVLSALLHDMGKRYRGIQGEREDKSRTYHRHEEISEKMARAALRALKAPGDVSERIARIVGGHMRPFALIDGATDRAVRRFLKDLGDDWRHVLKLAAADARAKAPCSVEDGEVKHYEELEERIDALVAAMDGRTTQTRPITGRDLAEIGIPQGPMMGEILRAIDDALLDNPAMTREEALAMAREMETGRTTGHHTGTPRSY